MNMSIRKCVILFGGVSYVMILAMYLLNPFNVPTLDPRGRVLGFIPYEIPGGSMKPTLNVGDHVLASTFLLSEPNYGDLVVFRFPENRDIVYIKRLIGKSGDTIVLDGDQIVRNGDRLTEGYVHFALNGAKLIKLCHIKAISLRCGTRTLTLWVRSPPACKQG